MSEQQSPSGDNTSLFHKASHPESVLAQLDSLRRQRLFTDVTLRAGRRSFLCHRAVLAACSRYFAAMFGGGLRESGEREVDLRASVHPEALEPLLDYAYTARLALSDANAERLLQAGDMLQFPDVRDAAAAFLERRLRPSNCLRLLLLSDAHQCRRLRQRARAVCLAHFQRLASGEEFCRLPEATLAELLASDELEAEDERAVHLAVVHWARHRPPGEGRRRLSGPLRHVRLALLPAPYLEAWAKAERLLDDDPIGRALVDEARRYQREGAGSACTVMPPCARPRRAGHTLLILGGPTFLCDQVYELEQGEGPWEWQGRVEGYFESSPVGEGHQGVRELRRQDWGTGRRKSLEQDLGWRGEEAEEGRDLREGRGRIVAKARLPSPRKEFSACALGRRVFLIGGRGPENGVSRDVWVYDAAAGHWSKVAPMLVARFGHGSAELRGGVFVLGGHGSAWVPGSAPLAQVERYEPSTNTWTAMAPLPDGVSNAAVVSAQLRLYVFGGGASSLPAAERRSRVQRYEPLEDRWAVPAVCPQPWRYTAAAALGSQIFIMGGDTEFTAASAYRFDCDTNQWTRVGDMTAKRMSCHAVASGNKLYVVGGYFGTQRCKTLDCYDPTSDTWSSITTVPYSLIPTAFVSTWKQFPD
ncbi:kelch-like protein 25 [Stegostoma tigrinum]|uniref:kelch-like protein 25 n=1 Tax=Stegostoma tigrinum TaxID=3053191 RepID=UPI00287041AD|nr:kelch-like protein 25 [Stegostoma tigrinum]XP_048418508.2 kelch-like protein 25 [Stegostoma tigrinum]XP_048418509.2 kelch-like protein 25 [Stegostoma tigrinum]